MAGTFAERWSRKEGECGRPEEFAAEMVPCGADTLPNEAAPFLSFDEAATPRPIYEVYGLRSQWVDSDRERLRPFLMIGSDGAGNPICIEHPSSAVVLLDHEDQFRSRQFVNSSVAQLAECLLAYMGESNPDQFRSAVRSIDAAALADGAFWPVEAAQIGEEI